MKLWGYYAAHSFINSIKKVFRSKVFVVIFVIFMIGVLFGVSAGIVASVVMPDEAVEESTEEDIAPEMLEEEEELSKEDIRMIKLFVEAGVALLLLLFLLMGLYSGSKRGSDIFMMADVNFLFTAPIKPQSVLLFRLSFQMVASVVASIYLVFQIPNLVINLNLSGYAVVAIFFAWIVLLLLQKLMSIFMYTLTATHKKLQKYVLPFILTVLFILIAVNSVTYLSTGKDVEETVSILYASNVSRMVPIIGWYKAMVMTAVDGKIGISLCYMGILLLSMILIVWGIWKMKADFYEDAFQGAKTRDELVHRAQQEGTAIIPARKERSQKIKRNLGLKGWGASAFFTKEIYNRKRFSYFGFVTKTMITYLVIGIVVTMFCIRIIEVFDFSIVGIILAIVLFFRNYGNPIASETSMQWLFLVPDDAYKKVFYAMAAGSYACAIDILPTMLVIAVLMRTSPLLLMLWYVTLIALDFMFSSVGMILEAIFPASALDIVKGLLQFVLKYVILIILALVLVFGIVIGGMTIGVVFVLLVTIAFGTLCFLMYPSMLHKGIS